MFFVPLWSVKTLPKGSSPLRFMTDTQVEGVVVVRRLPPIFPEIGINCNKTPRSPEGTETEGCKSHEAGFIAIEEAGQTNCRSETVEKTMERETFDRVR